MKIAILLFGHLRTFDYCSKYFIENVKNKFDCDIFMHTWDTIDSSTISWNPNMPKDKGVVKEKTKKLVGKIYEPKAIKFETQDVLNDEIVKSIDGTKEISLKGMKYMFHSMKSANELRKEYQKANNVEYDYVLVTRPDVAFYKYLDIEKIVQEAEYLGFDIENSRFFAGHYGDFKTNVRILCNRACDILFFGKPQLIDRYIEANQTFNKEKIDGKFLNIVSIYVQNELNAGILPVQVCFAFNKDWRNVDYNYLNKITKEKKEKKEKKTIKDFIRGILPWKKTK